MALHKIYAHISCSDLERSRAWFEKLFGRAPDGSPMKGLVEWHHGDSAGFQLFEQPEKAGGHTLTLGVTALRDEHARVSGSGLAPGPVESADKVSVVRLQDPDGNLVVLAQPGRA